MDMKISGSGQIVSGEYENIRISGSGKLNGFVRCAGFHSSGSSKGDEIECKNEFKVSGSGKFTKSVKAGSLSVSGSFACDGNLTVDEKISCSGAAKSLGNVKCGELSVSGAFKIGGDIEAEKVKVSGALNCGGLLNAEDIFIKFDKGMEIGSIGGSKIVIIKEPIYKKSVRLPLFSSMVKGSTNTVCVKNSIEGDNIAIESVEAQRVSGRVVAIGEGCEIDLVQYSEEIEVSPNAKVGRTEKI